MHAQDKLMQSNFTVYSDAVAAQVGTVRASIMRTWSVTVMTIVLLESTTAGPASCSRLRSSCHHSCLVPSCRCIEVPRCSGGVEPV